MEMNEGRVHLLKHTKFEDKQWVCDYVRSGCRGAVYTNLEVNTVLRSTPYSGTCTADEYVLYKIEKRNTLNRRAEEERISRAKRLIIQIFKMLAWYEAWKQLLMFNNVHNSVVIFCTEENLRDLAGHTVCCMDGTFKIVPEWYLLRIELI
ncbi:hypothetical protein T4D_12261 [Trichinella pseudospiralis]|uniref:FLYWCH-type domain-containing protein n=1 Tax=Trichinella pseudospiralis TaxID=6337 RepID=A0A0V1FZC5_TRIPS|nr:hypothetical protein T4D_12261 [Trichinella pseudospiralis]